MQAAAKKLKPVQLLRRGLRTLRTYNVSKFWFKNATLEIGQRKVNARVYARKILLLRAFQFLRTLTCVDKNATVEIHLKSEVALIFSFLLVIFKNF